MNVTPTPATAALAGIFSAIAWPWLWSRLGRSGDASDVLQIVMTVLVVAVPAHAFVMGFDRPVGRPAGTLDTALLTRIAAWLGAGVVTALLTSAALMA